MADDDSQFQADLAKAIAMSKGDPIDLTADEEDSEVSEPQPVAKAPSSAQSAASTSVTHGNLSVAEQLAQYRQGHFD